MSGSEVRILYGSYLNRFYVNLKKISYLFNLSDLESSERDTFIKFCIINFLEALPQLIRDMLFILILYKVFHASDDFQKGLLVSSQQFAHLISIFVTTYISSKPSRSFSKYCFVFNIISGVFMTLCGFFDNDITLYLIFSFISSVFLTLKVPLNSGTFQRNYKKENLPSLFGSSQTIMFATRFFISLFVTSILDKNPNDYRCIYMLGGVLSVVAGFLFLTIKENIVIDKNQQSQSRNPMRNLKLLFQYPIFAYMILIWFFIGSANIFALNSRTAYLSDEKLGLGLSAGTILILNEIIPQLIRIFSNGPLSYLYSKSNFAIFRISCNVGMFLGLIIIFMSKDFYVIALGQSILSLSLTGANITWNIWVNKIAPSGMASDFMSVHTFFTGIRGVLISFFVFKVFSMTSITNIAIIYSITIWTATIMTIPLIKFFSKN